MRIDVGVGLCGLCSLGGCKEKPTLVRGFWGDLVGCGLLKCGFSTA